MFVESIFQIPGKENKCPGLNYDITDHLPMLIDEEREVDEEPVCAATEFMPPMNATRVKSFVQSNAAGSCSTSDRDMGELEAKISTINDRKRKIKRDENFDDNEWSKTTDFNPQWIGKINQYQKDVRFTKKSTFC